MAQTITTSVPRRASKSITFDDGAGTGDIGAVPIFTVTGEVLIEQIVPFCTTTITEEGTPGGATISLGVTGATTLFIGATTALDIDANEFWVDTSPDANGVALPAALQNIVITDNIIGTIATDELDGGVIRFDVIWRPLSDNGLVA